VTPRLVRPQAEAELLDARDWYEDQRPWAWRRLVVTVYPTTKISKYWRQ
jgi:hypothetical protein